MQPLIVLGMHRSGTSLAASLLEAAGLDVGQRLLEANASNPKGHFEDADFVEFHRAVLGRLGLNDDGWLASAVPPVPDALVAKARALVERKALRARAWGWKDPRTVLFLPLWQALVPDARFAVVYRAPWEVVESLFKRGDVAFADDPELAVRVWCHYNRLLLDLALAAPERCLLCNVDAISADPKGWVAAVAARTATPLADPDAAIYEPALLHGDASRRRADLLYRHYPDVVELFGSLERLAFRPAGAPAPVVWTEGLRDDAERRLVMRDWSAAASSDGGRLAERRAEATAAERTAAGWCSCCRAETTFVETGTWLREHFRCERCQSIPRFRAVNHALDTYFPGWERAAIHEFSPPADFVRRHCANYTSSIAVSGASPAAVRDGARCERLEQLSFADATFDLVVTEDVLEHVFEPGAAVREIMRVVKPGGAHVFTAPKHKGLRTTRQRARLDHGIVTHLLAAEYHGDPLADDRELVTWDFGDDFEARLWGWCGLPTATYVVRDRRLGLGGEYLDVFITRKLAQDFL